MDESTLPPVVGQTEAAEILQWDRRRVATYYGRGKLPAPAAVLAHGPVWWRGDIERYKQIAQGAPGTEQMVAPTGPPQVTQDAGVLAHLEGQVEYYRRLLPELEERTRTAQRESGEIELRVGRGRIALTAVRADLEKISEYAAELSEAGDLEEIRRMLARWSRALAQAASTLENGEL